jgi:Tol biopolymer transport system component
VYRDSRRGYTDIYVVNVDGAGLRRLTDIFSHSPAWSPDGRYLLFSGTSLPPRELHLFVVRADGSEVHAQAQGHMAPRS